MLWVYDDAITKDLANCIDPNGGANNTVKMMGDEGMMGILAQLEQDQITFPAIFLKRHDETPVDNSRFNYARLHSGVATTYDPKANNIYVEKALPVELRYDLHVLTTNTADMDELIRELLFRYSAMYFLTIEVPYESKRKIRFGVNIRPNQDIQRKSGVSEYISGGRLYESIIELECNGAVLLNYTPRHVNGIVLDPNIHIE